MIQKLLSRRAIADVSPWNRNRHDNLSPEGTTGDPTQTIHVTPSGLRGRFDLPNHGFAPLSLPTTLTAILSIFSV